MRLRFWLGLIAVFAIAAGSVVAALAVDAEHRDDFERAQEEAATRSARQAEAVAELSVGQLASAAAFFQTADDLTRHDFEVLADSLLSEGALSGTSFVARVPRRQRAAYEARHGFPIVEPQGGQLRRAGARPEHFSVTYATSELPVAPAFGLDLGVDPDRAPILRRARDSGEAAATPIVPLLTNSGRGLIVYQPVYRDGAPTTTVAERRAALLGFASGGFLAPDLAAAATSAVEGDVELQLLENGDPVIGGGQPLEDGAAAPIQVADRAWLLVVRDPDRPTVGLAVLIAMGGISLAALLGALVLIWSRNERMQELRRQASQDSLTGLKNRRRFEEDLRVELARSRRENGEGALLMLDLDNFKQVNDTLGHPIGDRAIEEIAGVLRSRMRETDVLARLGGDEFAVVLPRCDAAEAQSVAEAILTAIREHVPPAHEVPPITASVGIAMFGRSHDADFESVQSRADTAMYEAKDAGRDAV
ncbi:MAG TPA: diguanylate cyclase, partial [Solirubrobacterales bacterium]|nr:diguanylate cyclase [Solirubrobacterales bacterium]